jgi:hypothetical protein
MRSLTVACCLVSTALLQAEVTVDFTHGFDNESSDNLWTRATNWNPNGLPVAPTSAVINGYDVILNSSAVSNPGALQILNGSLTLRDTGSVSVASMKIAEVLVSPARLVLEGSIVSL